MNGVALTALLVEKAGPCFLLEAVGTPFDEIIEAENRVLDDEQSKDGFLVDRLLGFETDASGASPGTVGRFETQRNVGQASVALIARSIVQEAQAGFTNRSGAPAAFRDAAVEIEIAPVHPGHHDLDRVEQHRLSRTIAAQENGVASPLDREVLCIEVEVHSRDVAEHEQGDHRGVSGSASDSAAPSESGSSCPSLSLMVDDPPHASRRAKKDSSTASVMVGRIVISAATCRECV